MKVGVRRSPPDFQRKYENNSVDDCKTKTEFQIINLHINKYTSILSLLHSSKSLTQISNRRTKMKQFKLSSWDYCDKK